MPSPNRLAARIAKLKRCWVCASAGDDWLLDENGGMKRCDAQGCLRGRLLRLSDRVRDGRDQELTEEEKELLR